MTGVQTCALPISTGHDAIEGEGIRRAIARAKESDIRILLFDATLAPDKNTLALKNENSLIVFNKADLSPPPSSPRRGEDALRISTKTGAGLKDLTDALVEKVKSLIGAYNAGAPSLTRERHRNALGDCVDSLSRALSAAAPELAPSEAGLVA